MRVGRLEVAQIVGCEGTGCCGVVWPSLECGELESRRGACKGGCGSWAGRRLLQVFHHPWTWLRFLEGGPEVMMGMSRPSSKNVPKGRTGTVRKAKGASSTT